MTTKLKPARKRSGVGPSNRKKPPVEFNEIVELYYLPDEQQYDAWRARFENWEEAPFHDELWDGYTGLFRDEMLTRKELQAINKEYKWRRRLPTSAFNLLYLRNKSNKNLVSNSKDEVQLFKEKRRSKRQSLKSNNLAEVKEADLKDHFEHAHLDAEENDPRRESVDSDLAKEKDRIRKDLQRRSKTRYERALELEAEEMKRERLRDEGLLEDSDEEEEQNIIERTLTAGSQFIGQLLGGFSFSEPNEPMDGLDEEDADEFEEADELFAYDAYMNRLRKIDGLNNTQVPQSREAASLDKMLLNTYNNFFKPKNK